MWSCREEGVFARPRGVVMGTVPDIRAALGGDTTLLRPERSQWQSPRLHINPTGRFRRNECHQSRDYSGIQIRRCET